MKRVVLLAAAALLLGADAAQARCATPSLRDVAADSHARIYVAKGRWYACLRSRDRPFRLVGAGPTTQTRVMAPFVAVTVGDKLRVFDLRTNAKVATRVSAPLTDLVLTRGGVAAFIADGRVQRLDERGAVSTLDEGARAGSLAATDRGTQLYWLKDGVARTAPLQAQATPRRFAPSPSLRGDRCPSPRVRGFVADLHVRVFSHNGDLFACYATGGKLRRFENTLEYADVKVAAPFVAAVSYAITTAPSGYEQLEILDLRDGDYVLTSTGAGVSELVLNQLGTAVYVTATEVRRFDHRGRKAKLDDGDARALALSPDGLRAYWTRDGVAKTKRLL